MTIDTLFLLYISMMSISSGKFRKTLCLVGSSENKK